MGKTNVRYWLCQLTGWGVWGMILLYFNFVVFGDRFKEQGGQQEYLISLAILLVCGILTTHLLRLVIKKTNWLKFSFNRIFYMFIISVGATGTLLYYGSNYIEARSGYSYDAYTNNQKLEKAVKMEKQFGMDSLAYYKINTFSKDTSVQKGISEIKKATGWSKNKKGEWVYEKQVGPGGRLLYLNADRHLDAHLHCLSLCRKKQERPA